MGPRRRRTPSRPSGCPRLEPHPGERRRGDPLDLALVALDPAEPPDLTGQRGPGLPGLARREDLLVAAADEVPPHDDLLAERLPAEDEDAGALGAGGEEHRAVVVARGDDGELGPGDVGARRG